LTGGSTPIACRSICSGRRYYLERAGVHFDGSIDPLLDVRITHDFPEVTTATGVCAADGAPGAHDVERSGASTRRASCSVPARREPAAIPRAARATPRRARVRPCSVTSWAAIVRGVLPVNIDVLRYETATATSGAAVRSGPG